MLPINKNTLKLLPSNPGIYQFLDNQQKILYVGKAKNLKKRVASYFRKNMDVKTTALMNHVNYIQVIITSSDTEALLLENTLIKKLHPKYNIFFKDDKSYPYLFLSMHQFPRLIIHRGAKNQNGDYYGPYPNAAAANESLHILQKIFGIRICIDTFFKHRKRPCIQYQIKRCTAPCVNYISENLYQQNVELLKQFLKGKNKEIIHSLTKKMQEAAKKLQYEEAAYYHKQINSLQKIQIPQYVVGSSGDADVIAIEIDQKNIGILVLLIRSGKVVGSESYFHESLLDNNDQIISSFISQYYLGATARFIPKKILIAVPSTKKTHIEDQNWLEKALNEQTTYKVKIITSTKKSNDIHWLKMATQNAKHALETHLLQKQSLLQSLQQLKEELSLTKEPKSIECFDISHNQGESTIASCVVFNSNGPVKKDYRRFNVENITKGDDYAAIEQAIIRRYHTHQFPDLIIIDGGKGQLHRAQTTLKNFKGDVISIAKGPKRKPGLEIIYTAQNKPLVLPKNSSSFLLLQRIRDEAHRFAITRHRQKLIKKRVTSVLENIYGIGSKKRRLLLEHFGGIQAIKDASIDELAVIPGINKELAKKIYDKLHESII